MSKWTRVLVAIVSFSMSLASIDIYDGDSIGAVRDSREPGPPKTTNFEKNDVDALQSEFYRTFDGNARGTTSKGRSISRHFEECSALCTSKPCCSGGLSSIKMMYHGPEGSLLVSDEAALSSFIKIDPCNDYRRLAFAGEDALDSIRFVDCNSCFPASKLGCNVALDTATVQKVSSGDTICLIHVDPKHNDVLMNDKFPSIIELYFLSPEEDDVVMATSIYTSCSKRIFAPFGVRIGECNDSPDFYVDMSTTSIGDGDSILEFIDGSSAWYPDEVFTDCLPTNPSLSSLSHSDFTCCKGGVSFMKIRLEGGTDVAGLLSIDPEMVLSSSGCEESDAGRTRTGKRGKKAEPIRNTDLLPQFRFIDCNDLCLIQPFNVECTTTKTEIDGVGPGEEFCIVSYQDEGVSMAKPLPKSVSLWFISEADGIVHSLLICSSCSLPFIGFGQTFGLECDGSDSTRVDMIHDLLDKTMMYVEFIDGFSAGYSNSCEALDWKGNYLDISFAGCGCACDRTGTPSPSNGDFSRIPSTLVPGPSTFPMIPSVDITQENPTLRPTCRGKGADGHGSESCSPSAMMSVTRSPGTAVSRSRRPSSTLSRNPIIPSSEPTSRRRPGPGGGEVVTMPSNLPSFNPSVNTRGPKYPTYFKPISMHSAAPDGGNEITTPSAMMVRPSGQPSAKPSRNTGDPYSLPSFVPVAIRSPVPVDGNEITTPSESSERPSRIPSRSVTISFEPTLPRRPGPGGGNEITTPILSETPLHPSRLPSAKRVPNASPSFVANPTLGPEPGGENEVTAPNGSLEAPSGRPHPKPPTHNVPGPCPTLSSSPVDAHSANPNEPTFMLKPIPVQGMTSSPTEMRSIRPTRNRLETIDPTREPELAPVPKKPSSPTMPPLLHPTNPSKHPYAVEGVTASPTTVPSARSSNPPSREPTTKHNPGPTRPSTESLEPTQLFSIRPEDSFSPSPWLGEPNNCNIQCEDWVIENCVMVGDDGTPLPGVPCEVSLLSDIDDGRFLGAIDADIAFHEKMIDVYTHLLAHD